MASDSKRNTAVFTTLLTVLGGSSLLLLAIRPAPLNGQGGTNQIPAMMAQATSQVPSRVPAPVPPTLPPAAPVPATPGASAPRVASWTNVFVHSTRGGSVEACSGDHFIILPGVGNGEGRLLINPSWRNQVAATGVKGVRLPEGCVTIVLAGDFDRGNPTPGQVATLRKLLAKLNQQFGISSAPLVVTDPNHPSAIGRNFSASWLTDVAGR